MLRVTKFCQNHSQTEYVVIDVCMPEPQEECPITSEIIGSSTYVPPYYDDCEGKQKNVKMGQESCTKKAKYNHVEGGDFFSDYPKFSCAEMECGHRFDVRALLIHFMCNAMNCPLCRAGVTSTLSCKTSFPSEKWMCDAENKILLEKERDESHRANEDEMLAGRLQSLYYFSLPSLLLNSLHEQSVTASIFFYDTSVSNNNVGGHYPIHGMQFDLELLPLELRHRDLSRGVSLYSSFSSNSIATPPPPPILPQRPPPPPVMNDNNLVIIPPLIQDDSSSDGPPFISVTLPGEGNELFSLEDITVQYAMSESTLR